MQWIIEFFKRHATTLFFPMALILYDFAAYLSTDLIQPGIINVVREFDADVSLRRRRSVSISPEGWRCNGAGAAFRPDRSSSGIGHGAPYFFPRLYRHAVHHFNDTVSGRARGAGHQHRFIATVGYVTVQEAFGQTKAIKLMAIITSIVLVAPIIGPLSGAALMHFVHWKVLFAIIAVMGFIAFMGLLLAMPETVQRGAVPFSAISVVRDFRDVFRNRVFLLWRRQ